MTHKWIAEILPKILMWIYKYRFCNDNNLAMLKNKTAWFSCTITGNNPIDVTVLYDIANSRRSEMAFSFLYGSNLRFREFV